MPSGLPSLDQITPEYLLDLSTSEFARLVRMYWPPEPEELVAWHLLWSTLRGHQDLRRRGLRVLDEELERCQVEITALRRRTAVGDGVMRGPNGYVSSIRDARTRLSAPDSEDPVPPAAPCPDHEPLPAAAELTPGRLYDLPEERLRKLLLDHLLPNPRSPDSWRTLWAGLHREPSLQARASELLRAEFTEVTQVLSALEELGFSPRKDPLWRGPRLLARSLREGLDRLRRGPTADRRTNWQSGFDVSYVRDQLHLHVGSHRQVRANVGCAADRRLWGCLESVPAEDWAALHFLTKALLDHRDVLTGGGERLPERGDLILWAALHEYSVDDGSGTRRPIRRMAPLVRRHSPLERLTDLRHAVRDHRRLTVRPRPPDETLRTATSAVLGAEALLDEVDPRSLLIDAVRSVQEHRDAVWASHRATSTDVTLWSALKWQVVWDATAKAVSLDSIHPRPADHPLTLMWACFYDIFEREFPIIGIEQEEVWQIFGPIVEDWSVPPGLRHARIIAALDRLRRPA